MKHLLRIKGSMKEIIPKFKLFTKKNPCRVCGFTQIRVLYTVTEENYSQDQRHLGKNDGFLSFTNESNLKI